ncbi:hypothetical protein F4604DRAFT_1949651 [Suillus subluteus]|nr:hypothetical protein F4604DRAFT_1949651 [Suillus subluteus]
MLGCLLSTRKVITESPSATRPPPVPSTAASELTGVRRKLPQGANSRPDSQADSVDVPAGTSRLPGKSGVGSLVRTEVSSIAEEGSVVPPPAMVSALPFSGMNMEAERARLAKDTQRWINEGGITRKALLIPSSLFIHLKPTFAS